MNPEMTFIGLGISIDKESQFAQTHMPVSRVSAAESESVSLAPVSKVRPVPAIGQTCWIKHQIKRAANGEVLGLMRADGKPVAAKITAVYLDGTVRTGVSDHWEVTPSTLGNWETVNPGRG